LHRIEKDETNLKFGKIDSCKKENQERQNMFTHGNKQIALFSKQIKLYTATTTKYINYSK